MSTATADILEQVAAGQRERKQEILTYWRDIVRNIADGKQPDDDSFIEFVLTELNRTPEDIAKAVETLKQRRELAKVFDKVKNAEKDRADLTRKLEAANAKLAKAQDEHRAVALPLTLQLRELTLLEGNVIDARARLWESCDPEFKQRVRELERELNALRRRRDEVAKVHERSKQLAGHQQVHADRTSSPAWRKEYAAEGERLQTKAQELAAQLADLESQMEAKIKEQDAIREQAMIP